MRRNRTVDPSVVTRQPVILSRARLYRLLLALAVASQVHAVSANESGFACRSNSPREVIGAAELIFAGRLVSQREDKTKGDQTIYTLAVALHWKGPSFQLVEITSSPRSPSVFDATQSFLVFANSRSANRWPLSVCYPRALPLDIAGEYLRALGEPV
jgi:hypothetical protein